MDILALLSDPQAWVSLLVLTAMEIVLGIDNIVFITILCGKLPPEDQLRGRRMGILAALVSRVLLLMSLSWVMQLEGTVFEVFRPWSGKDLILFFGGLFLLYKATTEIRENVVHPTGEDPDGDDDLTSASFGQIMVQIMVLDVVFSLDSVITAVGMADQLAIMVAAVLLAVGVMLIFAGPIGDFVQDNPTIRVLALSFLVLIGVMLMLEGTGQHVSKGYIYAAMGFSLAVELMNMRMRKNSARRRLEMD